MMEYGKLYEFKKDVLYFGNFKSDLKHGIGIEHYPDGSFYKGYFSRNKKSGKGIYKETKVISYEVEYEEDSLIKKQGMSEGFFQKIFS